MTDGERLMWGFDPDELLVRELGGGAELELGSLSSGGAPPVPPIRCDWCSTATYRLAYLGREYLCYACRRAA